VALVGRSGAGKSTIASLLLRFADPDAGRITVAGDDLRSLDAAAWRRQLAWVPQRPGLFAGTIADNIRLADAEASDERVRAAARAAHAGFVEQLPDGFDTVVGAGGRSLSLGEAQRIALARAFLRDAPVLVLDEPTAYLDPESAALVDEAIERLSAGRTTLLVVHRPALARRADRVLVVDGGRIVPAESNELAARLAA
jgi:ABC-type multidrug transport system fused ATPase/permease subunit